MFKQLLTSLQWILPQKAISAVAGWLANCRQTTIKNLLITQFIHAYEIDMLEAAEQNPHHYATFNDFFIRQLRPGLRRIAAGENLIVSPVDGTIAQIGTIKKQQLLQAKGMYFNLESLLGGDTETATQFEDGTYSTLYLAPYNYHRVHMPIDGTLTKTIYIPGNLFSVNKMTASLIPNLYGRNERLICLFDTAAGPMAVILIGALIVGSIQTVWMDQPIRANQIQTQTFQDGPTLAKSAELGHFKLGSTVILLFGKEKILWQADRQVDTSIQYGQWLGNIIHQ